MSKIMRPKTPFEFCVYPTLKEALEKTDYNQTELALEDLTGMTFRELFAECEGRR